MNEKERTELMAKVNEEIAVVLKDIAKLKDESKPIAPENAIGRVSRMDAINNKSVQEAALRKAKEKLSKLNYVLTRAEKEDFGACVRCGKQIKLLRLMYMPESSHCIKCAR